MKASAALTIELIPRCMPIIEPDDENCRLGLRLFGALLRLPTNSDIGSKDSEVICGVFRQYG
jgi:hypothetical protein